MPQVGELEPGLWLASGFGGHGLNTTAMAGELVARGMVDNDETWRLFAPYELVWAGGRIGRALSQSVYWGSAPVNAARAANGRAAPSGGGRAAPPARRQTWELPDAKMPQRSTFVRLA